MSLYTKHDEFLGHYRRYRPSALRKLVVAAGLQPVVHGGAFHSLLLVRVAQKLNERRQHVHSRPDVAAFGVRANSMGRGAGTRADAHPRHQRHVGR